jgi:hypothetical protein
MEWKLNTITEHITDFGAYLKTAHPTASGPMTLTESVVSIGDAAPPPPGTATNAVPTPDGPPHPEGTPIASVPSTNRWKNVNLSSFGFVPSPRVSTTPRPPPTHQHPSMGRPHSVRIPTSDVISDDESVGGPICLTHLADRDRLARACGAKWHDVLKLASAAYHVGYDGVKRLLECIITVALPVPLGTWRMPASAIRTSSVSIASLTMAGMTLIEIDLDPMCHTLWKRPSRSSLVSSLLQWRRRSGSIMTCSQLASITSYL